MEISIEYLKRLGQELGKSEITESPCPPHNLYLSRRTFMKAATAVVAGGLLASCAPSEEAKKGGEALYKCELDPYHNIQEAIEEARRMVLYIPGLMEEFFPNEQDRLLLNSHLEGRIVDYNRLEELISHYELIIFAFAQRLAVGEFYKAVNPSDFDTLSKAFPEIMSGSGGNVISLSELDIKPVSNLTGRVYKAIPSGGAKPIYIRLTPTSSAVGIRMVEYGNDLNIAVYSHANVNAVIAEQIVMVDGVEYLATAVEEIGDSLTDAIKLYGDDVVSAVMKRYTVDAIERASLGMFKKDLLYKNIRIVDTADGIVAVDIDFPQLPAKYYGTSSATAFTIDEVNQAMRVIGLQEITIDELVDIARASNRVDIADLIKSSSVYIGDLEAQTRLLIRAGDADIHVFFSNRMGKDPRIRQVMENIEKSIVVADDGTVNFLDLDEEFVVAIKTGRRISPRLMGVLKGIGIASDIFAVAAYLYMMHSTYQMVMRGEIAIMPPKNEAAVNNGYYPIDLDFLFDRASSVKMERSNKGENLVGYNIDTKRLEDIAGVVYGREASKGELDALRREYTANSPNLFSIKIDSLYPASHANPFPTPLYYTTFSSGEYDYIMIHVIEKSEFEELINNPTLDPKIVAKQVYKRACGASGWILDTEMLSEIGEDGSVEKSINAPYLSFPSTNLDISKGEGAVSGQLLPEVFDRSVIHINLNVSDLN